MTKSHPMLKWSEEYCSLGKPEFAMNAQAGCWAQNYFMVKPPLGYSFTKCCFVLIQFQRNMKCAHCNEERVLLKSCKNCRKKLCNECSILKQQCPWAKRGEQEREKSPKRPKKETRKEIIAKLLKKRKKIEEKLKKLDEEEEKKNRKWRINRIDERDHTRTTQICENRHEAEELAIEYMGNNWIGNTTTWKASWTKISIEKLDQQ